MRPPLRRVARPGRRAPRLRSLRPLRLGPRAESATTRPRTGPAPGTRRPRSVIWASRRRSSGWTPSLEWLWPRWAAPLRPVVQTSMARLSDAVLDGRAIGPAARSAAERAAAAAGGGSVGHQVPMALGPLQHLLPFERQPLRVARGQCVLDLVPGDRGRHRRRSTAATNRPRRSSSKRRSGSSR